MGPRGFGSEVGVRKETLGGGGGGVAGQGMGNRVTSN